MDLLSCLGFLGLPPGRVLRPLLRTAGAARYHLLQRQLSIPAPEWWQSGTAAAASVTRRAASALAPSRLAVSSLYPGRQEMEPGWKGGRVISRCEVYVKGGWRGERRER